MATIDRIDLYTLNSNSPLNHIIYPVVKKFDANKHRILLRVENIIYDVLDNNSSKKIYLPMDSKKGFQNAMSFSKPELKTVTIYAQLYDYQKDVILDTKKQDFTEASFFKMYNKTGVITSTLANTFSTYWNKTRRVEKVEGPFTTAECTTLATDIKTDVKYYFAATPKQFLSQTELLLMKWQYRYNDGELTDFNHDIESTSINQNVMSCVFHKNPLHIQVYAFFKEPTDAVSVEFDTNNQQTAAPVNETPNTPNANKPETTVESPKDCVCKDLYWGNKFTCEERNKIVAISKRLNCNPNYLTSAMALETGGTFDPSIVNSLGYTGLIQIGSDAAKDINRRKGTKVTAGKTGNLRKMSVLKQLTYVEYYLEPFKGKLNTLADFYLAILMPVDCGKGNIPNHVVFDKSLTLDYKSNGEVIENTKWVRKRGYKQNPAFFKEEREKGKTYVWEIAKVIQKWYEEGKSNKENKYVCNVLNENSDTENTKPETKPETKPDTKSEASESETVKNGSVLTEMKKLVDKHIPYSQDGIRNKLNEKGLAALDCSETVAIYLYKLGVIKKPMELYTGTMTTQKDFRNAIGNNNIDFVENSNKKDFKPQKGDIFVWRNSKAGHTGIVYNYDEKKDLVTILEAIGKVGSADESTNKNNGGYSGKGCSRTAVYKRSGKALASHDGWKGYFRPKNYTNQL
ncbi:hypothetical protein [Flavobacterium sp. GCM10027622]|uniref:hypothetical protein n=1 Tax=unclassified Flavobacterium TaxID=196869 RepID=UPI0036180272